MSPPRTHLARFIGISERCGRVLSPDMAASLYKHGYAFCKRYVALSQEAARSAMGDVYSFIPALKF